MRKGEREREEREEKDRREREEGRGRGGKRREREGARERLKHAGMKVFVEYIKHFLFKNKCDFFYKYMYTVYLIQILHESCDVFDSEEVQFIMEKRFQMFSGETWLASIMSMIHSIL